MMVLLVPIEPVEPRRTTFLIGVAQSLDHGVSTWRKYKYISGALNSKLSSKSRIPPMPGNMRPESFNPASRLKK